MMTTNLLIAVRQWRLAVFISTNARDLIESPYYSLWSVFVLFHLIQKKIGLHYLEYMLHFPSLAPMINSCGKSVLAGEGYSYLRIFAILTPCFLASWDRVSSKVWNPAGSLQQCRWIAYYFHLRPSQRLHGWVRARVVHSHFSERNPPATVRKQIIGNGHKLLSAHRSETGFQIFPAAQLDSARSRIGPRTMVTESYTLIPRICLDHNHERDGQQSKFVSPKMPWCNPSSFNSEAKKGNSTPRMDGRNLPMRGNWHQIEFASDWIRVRASWTEQLSPENCCELSSMDYGTHFVKKLRLIFFHQVLSSAKLRKFSPLTVMIQP